MKSLLSVTAIIEGITGFALVITPSLVASILLGIHLLDVSAIMIARLAGGALITIAIACWLLRNETQSLAMVKAMFGYNAFSIVLLSYVSFGEKISGPGLLPAIIVHIVLLIWCVSSLRRRVN